MSFAEISEDLQARNIHLRLEDDSILKDFEQGEMENPSARKSHGAYFFYESRGLRIPKRQGRPVLCDFGEARSGSEPHVDDIQPYVYRAPEVILDIPWSFSADIWNVGVVVSLNSLTLTAIVFYTTPAYFSLPDLGSFRKQTAVQRSRSAWQSMQQEPSRGDGRHTWNTTARFASSV